MDKPFADIQTDAEYLRAVGMGFYEVGGYDLWKRSTTVAQNEGQKIPPHIYVGPPLALHDTDPARKWDNLANVLRVLGPEMDRRGFSHECFIENLTHTDLLEAFYNAHAQGEVG